MIGGLFLELIVNETYGNRDIYLRGSQSPPATKTRSFNTMHSPKPATTASLPTPLPAPSSHVLNSISSWSRYGQGTLWWSGGSIYSVAPFAT